MAGENSENSSFQDWTWKGFFVDNDWHVICHIHTKLTIQAYIL